MTKDTTIPSGRIQDWSDEDVAIWLERRSDSAVGFNATLLLSAASRLRRRHLWPFLFGVVVGGAIVIMLS